MRQGVLLVLPSDCCSGGITYTAILQIAKENDIPVETRAVKQSELDSIEEAFTVDTDGEVTFVAAINERVVSSEAGPMTTRLQVCVCACFVLLMRLQSLLQELVMSTSTPLP